MKTAGVMPQWKALFIVFPALMVLASLIAAGCMSARPRGTPEQTVDTYLKAVQAKDEGALNRCCTKNFRPAAVREWMHDFTYRIESAVDKTDVTASIRVRFTAEGEEFPAQIMLVVEKGIWKVDNFLREKMEGR